MKPLTLFLCGDVMVGRGIDQLLAHPGSPELREDYVRDARDYIGLVEAAAGPIQRPVPPAHVWGEALGILRDVRPAARGINLETAITTSDSFWPSKGIHYRMHPANLEVLEVAGIDVCALANNHLLDFGRSGLQETLEALGERGILWSGAGDDEASACEPARVRLSDGESLSFFSVGHGSSGIPPSWSAGPSRSGLALLPDLSHHTADALLRRIQEAGCAGTLVIVSIHWGSNWGYQIPAEQRAFARRLVEGGVDLVHGHSSHHPRSLELHRGRLILYGCGDFIDDYEGIGGYERYRGDLRLMFFPTLASDGALLHLRLVVLQSHRLGLRRATWEDTRWMAAQLSHASFAKVSARGAGELELEPRDS